MNCLYNMHVQKKYIYKKKNYNNNKKINIYYIYARSLSYCNTETIILVSVRVFFQSFSHDIQNNRNSRCLSY